MKSPLQWLVVASVTMVSGISFSQTRYVSETGSDVSNNCQTPGNPCGTVEYANTQIGAGDTIKIAPGNYSLTATVNLLESVVITAWDPSDKPVLTTNQSTFFDIDAQDVTVNAIRMELGLTANTGKYGFVSSTGNFNGLTLTNNEILSSSPIIPYGMVWDAFAVRLNSTSTTDVVTIENNTIGTVTPNGNNIFGRGIALGSANVNGAGGSVSGNDIMAFYTLQAIGTTSDLTISNNTLYGVMMLNAPLTGTDILVDGNTFDAVTPMTPANLYALLEVRSVDNATVTINDNDFTNYVNIALLSEASKNVEVTANVFTPASTADQFISVMANTKLMTNAIQGNTYSDAITLKGNDFQAGLSNEGTAIVFADHYGVNSPAFGSIIVGGPTAVEQNSFNSNLGSYITLDEQSGSSTSYPLWSGYTATTMTPFSQNVEALAVNNNYNLVSFSLIEGKIYDASENAALGEVVIKSVGDNRYVATTGTDVSNDCTLPGNPCATIAHAILVAEVADTVFVAGGNYPQTAVLNVNVDQLTVIAQDINNKPVITTNQTTVFDIDGLDVTIYGMRLELGLTATTGKYGIVSTSSNFDGAVIMKNEIVSTSPVIPYGMVWDAFAIRLNAPAATSTFVAILDNTIGTATATGNNIFGRGISLGSGSTDGPGGTLVSNDVKAYYTIQAIRTNQDLNIANNDLFGITMLNAPLTGTDIQLSNNDVSVVTPMMSADSLYALIDVRAIENGKVSLVNNTISDYTRIGVLSMASKNVTVRNNQFTPAATATAFTSLMANTKLMTNGVQGNTYSDSISIVGNTFDAGAANGGTAIVFADHYGVNTPAFAPTVIGGSGMDKNTFNASLGNYIVLDDKTGPSSAVSLWAPYSVTTMKPVAQDVEALYINNTYNLPNVASVELKNIDSVDTNILGKVILAYTFAGVDEVSAIEAKLYPNPVVNQFTIEMTDKNAVAELTVIDLLGNVVYTSAINGVATIDVSDLTSGVYVVRLNKSGQTSSTRFVKN